MKQLTIKIQSHTSRFLLFRGENLPARLELTDNEMTASFTALGSSQFFMTPDKRLIAKISADKWLKRKRPIKWLLQDYIEKRLLLQTDARMEFRSLDILRRAGLTTPRLFGWGVSLNPANPWPSLLLLEHMSHTQSGRAYFEALNEADRCQFLQELSGQLASLIQAGYLPRDLHYNNLLIDPAGNIIWIDTHLKKTRINSSNCKAVLTASLSERKLLGQTHKEWIIERICETLNQRTTI